MIPAIVRALLAECDRRDMLIHEIADAAGVRKSTVSQWRHGRRRPSLAVVEQLTKSLGMTWRLIPPPTNGETDNVEQDAGDAGL